MARIPLPVRLACIVILVLAGYLQYARTHRAGTTSGHVVPSRSPDGPYVRGAVPGNPGKALDAGEALVQAVSTYRGSHGGKWPSGGDLTLDMLSHPQQYGFRDGRAASRAFRNPDTGFAEDPAVRRMGADVMPWLLHTARPDGLLVGGPRPAGLRDVTATCDLYVHMHVQHVPGSDSAVADPRGFYIVVWDDGAVERIPLKDTLRVNGIGGWVTAFRGQAGVPKGAVSFDEFMKRRAGRGSGGWW